MLAARSLLRRSVSVFASGPTLCRCTRRRFAADVLHVRLPNSGVLQRGQRETDRRADADGRVRHPARARPHAAGPPAGRGHRVRDDGSPTKYFVSSGSVTVNADSSVQLLAEEAFPLDSLDLSAAKANLEKAQAEMLGTADEAARAEVQIKIEANEAIVKALE